MKKVVKVKGHYVEVLRSSQLGGSRVAVEVQPLKRTVNRNEDGTVKSVTYRKQGEVIESFGGFIHNKHFNYAIAEQMALENAVARIK